MTRLPPRSSTLKLSQHACRRGNLRDGLHARMSEDSSRQCGLRDMPHSFVNLPRKAKSSTVSLAQSSCSTPARAGNPAQGSRDVWEACDAEASI